MAATKVSGRLPPFKLKNLPQNGIEILSESLSLYTAKV
jgi:hypothetical protein